MNFDYLLIKDVFVNSMEMKNPSLTISVNDIITVYNNLVEKNIMIFIPGHEDDPLSLLVEELGGKVIETKKNEK